MLFALMGTIGVGYLLNGSPAYETVNDYDYVTEITGLYSYTPVPSYAEYSPAQNNYQYSTTLENLGTYTSGINYTQAAAANLNPIITPSSGYVTTPHTITLDSFKSGATREYVNTVAGPLNNTPSQTLVSSKIYLMDLSAFLQTYLSEAYTSVSFTLPSSEYTYEIHNGEVTDPLIAAIPLTAQPICLVASGPSMTGYEGSITAANQSFVSAYRDGSYIYTATTNPESYQVSGYMGFTGTVTQTYSVGAISNLSVNANGTVSYDYTVSGQSQSVTKSISDLKIGWIDFEEQYWTTDSSITSLSFSSTNYTGVEYLDPNFGVSLAAQEAYWSNGSDLGAVTWAFQKPSVASTIHIIPSTATGEIDSFLLSWTGSMWQLSYSAPDGTLSVVDLGSGWQAVYVRAFYTGELQAGPIDGFFNFTAYTLGPATTYNTIYTGNEPIQTCRINGSTTMKFACISTTARSGVVPGAMYNAYLELDNYFPQYSNLRVKFDSAAYVGDGVGVGGPTGKQLLVDSTSFKLTATDLEGVPHTFDITQPWSITWNEDNTISLEGTFFGEAGVHSITIIDGDYPHTIGLGGTWAIDTDLYSVSSHIEEVFDWNFGSWGLEKNAFLVCTMGLTALMAIGFRLGGVSFRALDLVVIFFANVILWVIM